MTEDRKRGLSDDTSRGSVVRNGSEDDEVLDAQPRRSEDDPGSRRRAKDADADQSGTRGPRGKPAS